MVDGSGGSWRCDMVHHIDTRVNSDNVYGVIRSLGVMILSGVEHNLPNTVAFDGLSATTKKDAYIGDGIRWVR